MKSKIIAAAALAALALAGCGKESGQAASGAAPSGSAQAAAPQAPAPSAPAASALVGSTQGSVDGVSYAKVNEPGVSVSAGKVLVREYFWYGCPHCYTGEPAVSAWVANDPNVEFEFIPVAFNAQWEVGARLHHALKLQHLTQAERDKVFHAIHAERIRPDDKARLIEWAGKNGWDAAKLEADWKSFPVDSALARDKAAAQALGLEGVPMFTVNGKYLIGVQSGPDADKTLPDSVRKVAEAVRAGKLEK